MSEHAPFTQRRARAQRTAKVATFGGFDLDYAVQVCCCLGAGTSQETDPATLSQLQTAWSTLRASIASIPDAAQRALELQLGERWQLRRSWLEEPGQSDFSTLKEWLAYASSDRGAGAAISRNLTPDELQLEGDRFGAHLAEDIDTFAPLFRHAYGDGAAPSVHTPDARSQPSALHPKVRQELLDLRSQLMAQGELPCSVTYLPGSLHKDAKPYELSARDSLSRNRST